MVALHVVIIAALSLVLGSFVISTIVVAVQKSNLQDDLDKCKEESNKAPTTAGTTTTTVEPPSTTTTKPTKVNYRLPGIAYTSQYNLLLHPDLEKQTFTGKVSMDISVHKKTKQLILHSKGLKIEKVQLTNFKGKDLFHNFTLDEEREFIIIEANEEMYMELSPGSVFPLSIEFSGGMKDKMIGFYSSSYMYYGKKR